MRHFTFYRLPDDPEAHLIYFTEKHERVNPVVWGPVALDWEELDEVMNSLYELNHALLVLLKYKPRSTCDDCAEKPIFRGSARPKKR